MGILNDDRYYYPCSGTCSSIDAWPVTGELFEYKTEYGSRCDENFRADGWEHFQTRVGLSGLGGEINVYRRPFIKKGY